LIYQLLINQLSNFLLLNNQYYRWNSHIFQKILAWKTGANSAKSGIKKG